MERQSSAIDPRAIALRDGLYPLLLGTLAVSLFAFSLPATRAAARGLDPTFVGLGRAVLAAVLALAGLRVIGVGRPPRAILGSLLVVSVGCVLGFPLLTAIALHHLPSVHGSVATGLLPISTTVFAAIRAHERPSLAFWLISLTGVGCVVVYAIHEAGGSIGAADLLLLAGVAICGFAYAEGAIIARDHGGVAVISWAILLALPVTLPVTVWRLASTPLHAPFSAWLGFAYIGTVSMYFAFIPWYHALAMGGIARIGQIQLIQPALAVVVAAVLLGEQVDLAAAAALAGVVACAAAGRRARGR